jgi:hypothetical protein
MRSASHSRSRSRSQADRATRQRTSPRGREKSTHCAPSTAACSPEFPRMSGAPAHAGTPWPRDRTPPVSSRRTRDAARRSPDRNSSRSRRSVATRSLILSDSHGDKAARPMRRSTPGRAGSARSLSGDIMGLLDFGDQRIPVLRNAVDFARAPIRLAPD